MPLPATAPPAPTQLRSTEVLTVLSNGNQPRVGTEISLRKLQIFWAASHAGSLTRAAKILSLTQPTVSQQIAALETAVGNKLFERLNNTVTLTEFGIAFTGHAERVLRAAQELEDMVSEFGQGQLQTIKIAGVPSALRALLPPAMLSLQDRLNAIDFDMHEGGPEEVLDMLYARRINMALLAAGSSGELTSGFVRIPLMSDPYVLVVPEAVDLAAVGDLDRDLPEHHQQQMRRTIQFAFGNQNSRRHQHWLDTVLPGNRTVARARSFELVLEMVRGGLGVCIAPALSAAPSAAALNGVRLYRLNLPPRELVAIIPSHYQRQEPFVSLIAALQAAALALPEPVLAAEPPFIAHSFPHGESRGAVAP